MFLADLFYASFMILVTNFLVWMLMGILLEVRPSSSFRCTFHCSFHCSRRLRLQLTTAASFPSVLVLI